MNTAVALDVADLVLIRVCACDDDDEFHLFVLYLRYSTWLKFLSNDLSCILATVFSCFIKANSS